MLFKSSLPVTRRCLSLLPNSLTCDFMGSVCPPPNSSCQSYTSISSPTSSFHDADPLPSPLLDLPNIHHPIPLLQWLQLALSHRLLRNQHCQPCPQPLLHPHPSPPHLHPMPTPIPPPKHAQPISTHSGRWQELMALSEFMCPFP
jgi:hypothetical protein